MFKNALTHFFVLSALTPGIARAFSEEMTSCLKVVDEEAQNFGYLEITSCMDASS